MYVDMLYYLKSIDIVYDSMPYPIFGPSVYLVA